MIVHTHETGQYGVPSEIKGLRISGQIRDGALAPIDWILPSAITIV